MRNKIIEGIILVLLGTSLGAGMQRFEDCTFVADALGSTSMDLEQNVLEANALLDAVCGKVK